MLNIVFFFVEIEFFIYSFYLLFSEEVWNDFAANEGMAVGHWRVRHGHFAVNRRKFPFQEWNEWATGGFPPPFSPPTLHPPPPPLPPPSLPPWADTRFSVAALVEVLSDGGVLSYRRGCIGTCLIFPRPVKSAAMRTVKQGVGRFSKRRWRPVSERLERLEHGVWIGPFPLRCCMLPRLIQMFS